MMMIKSNTAAVIGESHMPSSIQTHGTRTHAQYPNQHEASKLATLSSLVLLEELLEERAGTDRRQLATAWAPNKDRRCKARRKTDQ